MLNLISEKLVGKDTYQAFRNSENLSEVVVLRNGISFDYGKDFKQFWINLK
jgi:hypothetical protein